jgi:hypothetical protein
MTPLARTTVRAVYCPACGARPGARCVGARRNVRISNHQERVELAVKNAQEEAVRQRFVVNDKGELEARDGTVLGRLVSLTIEGPSVGTIGVGVLTDDGSTTNRGGVGEQNLALLPSPAEEVWSTYIETMNPRRRELDPDSRRIINDALKVASVPECQRAIAGCAASDWHMGRDPQTAGRSYKQLSQILKGKRGGRTTREQIDFFIEIADKAGVASEGVQSVDPVKLSRCKLAVMTAWEFPADERAAAAGDEARQWLAEHGVAVEMSGTGLELGRPSFRTVR